MALSNYNDLSAAIIKTLNRGDDDELPAMVPVWVSLVEAQVSRELQHRRMICRAGAAIASEYTPLPNNYVSVQTLHIETGNSDDPFKRLLYVEPQNLADMADANAQAGEPVYYSVVGKELRVYPTPDKTYAGKLHVYERVPSLQSHETNWLLTYFPDVYLYGALMHSAPYLEDDKRLALWERLFNRAMAAAQVSDPTETDNTPRRVTDMPLRRQTFDIRSG